MKKLSIFALIFVLAISLLTACGGNKEKADEHEGTQTEQDAHENEGNVEVDAEEEAEAESQAKETLINWMRTSKYSFDYTTTSLFEGEETTTSGSMAMDGDKVAISTEMTVEGVDIKQRLIIDKDNTYIIDDVNELITKVSGVNAETTGGALTDYSAIGYVGKGEGDIDGKTLPYQEYVDRLTGASIKYFLEDGQVYGYESEYDGYKSITLVTNAENSVSSGIFTLPTNYEERTM